MDLENLNNDMIPVGTTVHINPEDIKWEVQGDLISREALKKSIKSYANDQYAENEYLGEYAIMNIIDNAPTVNLEKHSFIEGYKEGCEYGKKCYERLQGEWIENNYGKTQCSICKSFAISTMTGCLMDRHLEQYKTKFCPWCGADMREGGAE